MNTDQLIPILKTLKTQAVAGAWEQALSLLAEPVQATPAKDVVVETPDAPVKAKVKRVMSEEQKAKMKAGREAAKAKKDAEKAASAKRHLKLDDDEAPAPAPPVDKPKRVLSEEQKAKMKAGREAAKAKKAGEKARLAAEDKAELQALVDASDRGQQAREKAESAPEVLYCADCHTAVGENDHRHCFFRGKGGEGYESEKAWVEAARAYTATLTA